VRAQGPQAADGSVDLGATSASAKRAHFASVLNAAAPKLPWSLDRVLLDRRAARRARPEVVRVRCGNKIHRLRLCEFGGPVILLDHRHLDRKAEMAMVVLGAPYPDCLLVFDAVTRRISPRNILWRRRAYAIADRAWDRRFSRRRESTPALEQSLAERYARFVRHRASLWLSGLLPANSNFEVRVVAPPGVRPIPRSSELWSWRLRPGVTSRARSRPMTFHVPLDWHVVVEQAHAAALHSAFIVDARTDRRGRMIQSVQVAVTYPSACWPYVECTTQTVAIDSATPVSPKRWQRAKSPCRLGLPDHSTGAEKL
jgi:hypothetical protein